MPTSSPSSMSRFPPTPDARWKAAQRARPKCLPKNDNAFNAAKAIFQGEWRRRAELESRVLTHQSAADIAAKMKLSVAVVETYETWFFAVRQHLANQRYIFRFAIGRSPSTRLPRRKFSICWKWSAYQKGLEMLEQLLTAVDRKTLINQGVDCYWQPESKLEMKFKAWIGAMRVVGLYTRGDVESQHRYLSSMHAQLGLEPPPPLPSYDHDPDDDWEA